MTAKMTQIWPKRAQSWPKMAPQDGPDMAPQVTQVDPNMDTMYHQHVTGSVEWCEPLEKYLVL
jgi:hypothetical protein